ncbi:molybdopterin molybdotransferase MoeA [Corynebacterium uterequi]|uniref:Molybdopterin molybdenumtransferase n=1 Tax=Corynebacterium uterequi TaxID=1072256 RepID=A0A0G3HDT9_9CORY|nr:molybdopterin molybdotransferase MoeA [Corynebacterium uterequi]AKK10885.1 molybdopterin molybdochelatase [Corynebacterium uterequi]
MDTIDDHLARVLATVGPALPARRHRTVDAAGLVLATDASAVLAVPPFANSAMDGFLVHDTTQAGDVLTVVADVPAGSPPRSAAPGQAVRIMTGAPVPEDHRRQRVIPVELTDIPPGPQPTPATVTIRDLPGDRTHIRDRGDNIPAGHPLLRAGQRLDAGRIAAAVAAGIDTVLAHPAPRVRIIATGDELAPPGAPLGPGQIPNSNLPMLAQLAADAGAAHVQTDHRPDDPTQFLEATSNADLLITSGGISAGAFDPVRAALSDTCWFGEVAQRPGAPQGTGRYGATPVVCLPGNPVAAFVSFHLYAAPAIRALAGRDPRHQILHLRAEGEVRRRPHHTTIIPCIVNLSDGTARLGDGASHRVASLGGTTGLALIPPNHSDNTIPVIYTG